MSVALASPRIREEPQKKRTTKHISSADRPKPAPSSRLGIRKSPASENGQESLPTFDWEVGYRLVIDPQTGKQREVRLTLFDVLYESEADIGKVFMGQGPDHAILIRLLAVMIQAYLTTSRWLVLNDVFIRWGRIPIIQPKAPDISFMPGGRKPPRKKGSYVVGRDGPKPAFVIEVTSQETRDADLNAKKDFYAAQGIKEYLIVDTLPEEGDDWQLIGYRLTDSPLYTKLTADPEGGISFETVGLRFVAVGSSRVDVFDSVTGEKLLTQEEYRALATAEAAKNAQLEERIRQLEAQLKGQSPAN